MLFELSITSLIVHQFGPTAESSVGRTRSKLRVSTWTAVSECSALAKRDFSGVVLLSRYGILTVLFTVAIKSVSGVRRVHPLNNQVVQDHFPFGSLNNIFFDRSFGDQKMMRRSRRQAEPSAQDLSDPESFLCKEVLQMCLRIFFTIHFSKSEEVAEIFRDYKYLDQGKRDP